jgi:hypothetical protein
MQYEATNNFVFVALLQRKAAGIMRSNLNVRETRSINSMEAFLK